MKERGFNGSLALWQGAGAAGRNHRLIGRQVEALAGRPATAESVAQAADGAGDGLTDVNADIHAGADYRRAMVGVFAQRALKAALARSQ